MTEPSCRSWSRVLVAARSLAHPPRARPRAAAVELGHAKVVVVAGLDTVEIGELELPIESASRIDHLERDRVHVLVHLELVEEPALLELVEAQDDLGGWQLGCGTDGEGRSRLLSRLHL